MHGFVNCVGLIDGTQSPLAFAPKLNAEEYFTMKGGYAIKGLIMCDNVARLTWIQIEWQESVQNNRVWSNSEIHLCQAKYFDHNQYFRGDSAFSAYSIMVHTFYKGHNANFSEEKAYFNTKLAKIRIKS